MEISNVILSAVVSVITALITVSFKASRDRKSYEEKLKIDHLLSEKKKIKESISKYKIHMLNACEDLNNRLKSLMLVQDRGWHNVGGHFLTEDRYYFHSFVYRFASIVWWENKVEKELVYLDTTVADREDLDFIKFCKKFNAVLCQAKLFDGTQYDDSKEKDHFFRHKLVNQVSNLSDGNSSIIDYSVFESDLSNYIRGMRGVCEFIDGISPNEERHRWSRMYCLQLLISSFLNNYGYDFQKVDDNEVKVVINSILNSNNGDIVLRDFVGLLGDYKLIENPGVVKLVGLINA